MQETHEGVPEDQARIRRALERQETLGVVASSGDPDRSPEAVAAREKAARSWSDRIAAIGGSAARPEVATVTTSETDLPGQQ